MQRPSTFAFWPWTEAPSRATCVVTSGPINTSTLHRARYGQNCCFAGSKIEGLLTRFILPILQDIVADIIKETDGGAHCALLTASSARAYTDAPKVRLLISLIPLVLNSGLVTHLPFGFPVPPPRWLPRLCRTASGPCPDSSGTRRLCRTGYPYLRQLHWRNRRYGRSIGPRRTGQGTPSLRGTENGRFGGHLRRARGR